jgi:CRP/FNR family transcriptional regulator, cyclic AMP receptor protein
VVRLFRERPDAGGDVIGLTSVADVAFYIQQASKLTVLSEQGKEAVVAILEPGHLFAEGGVQ